LFSVILSNFDVKLNYWQLLVKFHSVKCYEGLSSSPEFIGDGQIWRNYRIYINYQLDALIIIYS